MKTTIFCLLKWQKDIHFKYWNECRKQLPEYTFGRSKVVTATLKRVLAMY